MGHPRGQRPATPEEAAADYRKRLVSLEASVSTGLFSPSQEKELRAELEKFAGYPRPADPPKPLEGLPEVVSLPKECQPRVQFRDLTNPEVRRGDTPGWQRLRVDPEAAAVLGDDLIRKATDEFLAEILKAEEQIAIVAVRLGCAYASIRREDFERNKIVQEFVLLPNVHELRRLDFPSWDAFHAWDERGRPL